MENKNYTRKLFKWISGITKHPLGYPSENLVRHIGHINASQKFVMPDGGLLFPKGIDCAELLDDPIKYNLPFKEMVIEYCMPQTGAVYSDIATEHSSRRIVLAKDLETHVAMSCVWSVDRLRFWDFGAWMAFDKQKPESGWYPIQDSHNDFLLKYKSIESVVYDVSSEGTCILHLLAALTCKNIEVSSPRSDSKKIKKGAIPFDEYRRFMLSSDSRGDESGEPIGDRRSPREHLRRGHIRRLHTGNVWVNAAVINAGAAGKIKKEYVAA